ncbi:MAG: penicillin-binding protein 2 [Patescibacteria group bacterium]|nr:penicillin-binding protein 2 [Patescibacteria group bacterium]
MKFKFWFIRIACIGIFGALLANLYIIQVSKGQYYTKQAQAQDAASGELEAQRGVLYMTDKNGNAIPAVLNKDYPILYAVPKELEKPNEAALAIAPLVQIPVETLEKSFNKHNDLYELIKEKASDEEVERVKALQIKGIYEKDESFRFYPFGTMASQVFGFVSSGQDDKVSGRYGLELQFDQELRGINGVIKKDSIQGPQAGKDIYTTLDRNVQAEAEQIIKSLMSQWNADSASAIVEDPYTGKILAMANMPSFDPNEYSQYDIGTFLNNCVQSLYEPGSVIKVLTMSAGIDSGKITPDTTYHDTGSLTLNGMTIYNWDRKAHGTLTMTNVIEQSLNTGAAFAERTMGKDIFASYFKKFGLGEATGINLPGEIRGNIRNIEGSKEEINYATASYGQGIAITPIELITAESAIANGGLLLKPIIRTDEETQVIRRVMSEETANKVKNMMVSAVDKNILAAIPQYNIAGKTGTAFIPKPKGGGYYNDKFINTFIGFAPASRPKFIILIKLVNPQHAPLAGQTVVPAFKNFAQYLLNYYEIAPDRTATTTPTHE